MFIFYKKRKILGSSLIELLISCAVFCFMAICIFIVLHIGSVSWMTADEKYGMEHNVRKSISDINSNLINTDISSFNTGRFLSADGAIYPWMAFKVFFSNLKNQFSNNLYIDFFSGSKNDLEINDSKFFVLYYLSPPKIDDKNNTKKEYQQKNLVKLIIPIDENNEKRYMTRADVKYFVDPLNTKNNSPFVIANNIAELNASFNDAKNFEKSNDDEIPDGTINYFIIAFREVDKSSRKIDEVAKNKLIKEYDKNKQLKKTEKYDLDSRKNRYSMQINQSIVPFNNGKIN